MTGLGAALFPLIFFLALLFAFLWIIGKFSERLIGRLQHRTQRKIFYVYAVLLLTFAFIYEWVPKETEAVIHKEETLEQFKADVLDGEIIPLKTWSLPTTERRLVVLDVTIMYGSAEVFIKEKEAQDSRVDIAYYPKLIIGGLDLSKDSAPPDVHLEGAALHVTPPEQAPDVYYSIFQKEHVVSQFTGESWMTEDSAQSTHDILVVTVPAGMTVTAESAAFLNEN